MATIIKDDCDVGRKVCEIESLMNNLGVTLHSGVNGEIRINVKGRFGDYSFAIINPETNENSKYFPRCTDEQKLLWVNFEECVK